MWSVFFHPRRSARELAALRSALDAGQAEATSLRQELEDCRKEEKSLRDSLEALRHDKRLIEAELEETRALLASQNGKIEDIARGFELMQARHESYLKRIAVLRARVKELSAPKASAPASSSGDEIAPCAPLPQKEEEAPAPPPEPEENSDWYLPPPELM